MPGEKQEIHAYAGTKPLPHPSLVHLTTNKQKVAHTSLKQVTLSVVNILQELPCEDIPDHPS